VQTAYSIVVIICYVNEMADDICFANFAKQVLKILCVDVDILGFVDVIVDVSCNKDLVLHKRN
jgi:hypothetical protein